MHLYLKSASFTTEVPSIGLKDGCLPIIGSQSVSTLDNELLPQIEPAIWFKVQVIDAVSIDCTKRSIHWNSATVFNNQLAQICEGSSDSEHSESGNEKSGEHKSEVSESKPTDAPKDEPADQSDDAVQEIRGSDKILRKQRSLSSRMRRRRISESMYIGGECYGYQSDLDELFDTAQQLLADYAEGKISNRSMNEIIFKLLHCYILPAIKLTGDDLPKVIASYKLQEDAVEVVDGEILAKNKEMETLQKAMRTQRVKRFLPELSTDSQAATYHPDFAVLLQKHIDTDINHSWDSFDSSQDAVEKAKVGNDPDLEAKRKERNWHFAEYEKLLGARETLRHIIAKLQIPDKRRSRISRTLRPKSKSLRKDSGCEIDPLQSVYIGMEQELLHRVSELQALADKKVLVISVKEAIRSTMQELRSGDDTFGIEIDKTGRIKATDVLRHSNIPKGWQTLSEQVSSIISDLEHSLGCKHRAFCETLTKQCNSLDSEKQLFFVCGANSGHSDTSGSEASQLLESEVSVKKVLDSPAEKDASPVSESPQRSSSSSKVSGTSSRDSTTSSKRSSLGGDFDRLADRQTVPSQHILDTLPQNTKGVACFPLPFRRISKSKPSSNLSSSANSRNSSPAQSDNELASSQETRSVQSYRISNKPDDSYIIVHDSEQDFSRKMIAQLKESIHSHLRFICSSLQQELNYTDDAYFRKIWLCYETLFYEEMMPPLVNLYEKTFSSVSYGLRELLPMLTPDDLDIGASIVVHMLQDKLASLDCTFDSELGKSEENIDRPKSAMTLPNPSMVRDSLPDTQGMEEYKLEPSSSDLPLNNNMHESLAPTPSIKLKTIKIHHPSMVTVLYDRRTWPLPQRFVPFTESLDCGIDSLGTIGDGAGQDVWFDDTSGAASPHSPCSPRSPAVKEITFKPDYRDRFSIAFESLLGAVTEKSPLLKLQHLTRCLREISQQVATFHKQFGGEAAIGACTDELIDFLVVVLCNCRTDIIGKIYPHIMLLTDLIPPFFEGGPYSFSLVQFSVALEFLQDRLVMKRRNS